MLETKRQESSSEMHIFPDPFHLWFNIAPHLSTQSRKTKGFPSGWRQEVRPPLPSRECTGWCKTGVGKSQSLLPHTGLPEPRALLEQEHPAKAGGVQRSEERAEAFQDPSGANVSVTCVGTGQKNPSHGSGPSLGTKLILGTNLYSS